jgi:hypothetical protein
MSESKNGGLTKKQKDVCDQIIEQLTTYFSTSEGAEMSEQIHDFLSGQKERQQPPPMPTLTSQEQLAFRFIQKETQKSAFPSIRAITKAIGCRSSRTGYRVIQALKRKGYLDI